MNAFYFDFLYRTCLTIIIWLAFTGSVAYSQSVDPEGAIIEVNDSINTIERRHGSGNGSTPHLEPNGSTDDYTTVGESSTGTSGIDVVSSSEGGTSSSTGNNYRFVLNSANLGPRKVEVLYLDSYSNGVQYYGSWDLHEMLPHYYWLVGSLLLLVFSLYLFMFSNQSMRQSNVESNNDNEYTKFVRILIGVSIFIIPFLWTKLIFWIKGIPVYYFVEELRNYPYQFLPAFILPSILLILVSVFHFTLAASAIRSANGPNTELFKSILGIIFSLLTGIAAIITISGKIMGVT